MVYRKSQIFLLIRYLNLWALFIFKLILIESQNGKIKSSYIFRFINTEN